MGVVFEALDEERGARVAVKTLSRLEPEEILWIKREYRNLAEVVHPNLVTLHELGCDGDRWFIVMDLVDGVDWYEHVRGPCTEALDGAGYVRLGRALRGLVEGTLALHHHAGLLHLDLKPGNVIVRPDGHVVILDFGLTRPLGPSGKSGQVDDSLVGTIGYMAPEILRGEPPTTASDLFSIGVMLFGALVGRPPFEGPSTDVYRRMLTERAPRPSTLEPGIPAHHDEACERLLEPDPSSRWTGTELAAFVDSLSSGRGSSRPVSRKPRSHDLIGREQEVAWLDARLEELLAAGTGGIISIEGPAGIGKSCLVDRVLHGRDAQLVLEGQCFERDTTPYKGLDPLMDALYAHLRATPSTLEAVAHAEVGDACQLFPVLAALPGLASTTRRSQLPDPKQQRRVASLAWRRLLVTLASLQPIILYIDDAQWVDRDSARLLLDLLDADEEVAVVLILVSRSDGGASTPFEVFANELRPSYQAHQLVLAELAEDTARALTHACLGGADAEERTVASIVGEARGNPLLIEELARFYLAGRRPAGVVTLERALQAQLADLTDGQRRLMWAVAMAGEPTDQATLLTAARLEQEPHGPLASLRASGLVWTAGPRADDMVMPSHGHIVDHVLGMIPEPDRRELHEGIATGLERSGGAPPGRLARHLHAAGHDERASTLSEQAGDLAATALAFDVAAKHYADALEWTTSSSERECSLRSRRGMVLMDAGRPGVAGPEFRAAARIGGPERFELGHRSIDAFLSAGRVDEGLELLIPELRRLGLRYPAGTLGTAAGLLRRLVWLWLRGIEPRARPSRRPPAVTEMAAIDLSWSAAKALNNILPLQSMFFSVDGLLRSLAVGEPFRVGRGLAVLGGNLSMVGGAVARAGQACLDRAERLVTLLGGSEAGYLRGLIPIMRAIRDYAVDCAWHDALANVDAGMAILRASCRGLRWEGTLASAIGMTAAEMLGDMHDYGRRLSELLRESDESGDLYHRTVAGQCEVVHAISRGEVDRARRVDAQVVESWFGGEMTVQQAVSVQLNLRILLYEGRPASARQLLESKMEGLRKAGLFRISFARIAITTMMGSIAAAEAGESAERRPERLRELRGAARRLAKESRADGRLHGSMLAAVHDALQGNAESAAGALQACATGFERHRMQLHALACHRRIRELEGLETTAIDQAMRARGIAEPGRYARLLVPPIAQNSEREGKNVR